MPDAAQPQRRPYRSRDGVQIAPPAEHYELLMRHRDGQDLRASCTEFEALLELRTQLIGLGYTLVRLDRKH